MPEEENVKKTKLYGTLIFLSISYIVYMYDLLKNIAFETISVLPYTNSNVKTLDVVVIDFVNDLMVVQILFLFVIRIETLCSTFLH